MMGETNHIAAADAKKLIPALIAVIVVAAGILHSQGRVWWCACARLNPWSGEIWSSHNSQHLIDPYSFTHLSHGVAFCGLTWLVLRRWVPPWGRLVAAASLEGAWELVENSEWIINKYREATISLDYFGDSVINSVGDILCCIVGWLIASRLPWWGALILFVTVEIALMIWIKDSLIINVIMLAYPIDAIKTWQMTGKPA